MKRIYFVLTSFLLLSLAFGPGVVQGALAYTAPAIPTPPTADPDDYVDEDTQEDVADDASNLGDDINAALEDPSSLSQVDTRKELILDSTELAKSSLSAADQAIDNCQNCTKEQKEKLHECTAMAEDNIEQYEKDVQGAETQDDLNKARTDYVARTQGNVEKVKSCVMTASAIGIGVMLEVSYTFLQQAEEYWNWLKKGCVVLSAEDKQSGDEIFKTGYNQYNELKKLYDAIYADGVVSSSEQAQLEQAITLSVEYGITLASIYLLLYSSSELCGVPVPA